MKLSMLFQSFFIWFILMTNFILVSNFALLWTLVPGDPYPLETAAPPAPEPATSTDSLPSMFLYILNE